MNKKLGKVAAIALSAAMISSAFAMSTSASFAAVSKPAAKATLGYDTYYLAKGTPTAVTMSAGDIAKTVLGTKGTKFVKNSDGAEIKPDTGAEATPVNPYDKEPTAKIDGTTGNENVSVTFNGTDDLVFTPTNGGKTTGDTKVTISGLTVKGTDAATYDVDPVTIDIKTVDAATYAAPVWTTGDSAPFTDSLTNLDPTKDIVSSVNVGQTAYLEDTYVDGAQTASAFATAKVAPVTVAGTDVNGTDTRKLYVPTSTSIVKSSHTDGLMGVSAGTQAVSYLDYFGATQSTSLTVAGAYNDVTKVGPKDSTTGLYPVTYNGETANLTAAQLASATLNVATGTGTLDLSNVGTKIGTIKATDALTITGGTVGTVSSTADVTLTAGTATDADSTPVASSADTITTDGKVTVGGTVTVGTTTVAEAADVTVGTVTAGGLVTVTSGADTAKTALGNTKISSIKADNVTVSNKKSVIGAIAPKTTAGKVTVAAAGANGFDGVSLPALDGYALDVQDNATVASVANAGASTITDDKTLTVSGKAAFTGIVKSSGSGSAGILKIAPASLTIPATGNAFTLNLTSVKAGATAFTTTTVANGTTSNPSDSTDSKAATFDSIVTPGYYAVANSSTTAVIDSNLSSATIKDATAGTTADPVAGVPTTGTPAGTKLLEVTDGSLTTLAVQPFPATALDTGNKIKWTATTDLTGGTTVKPDTFTLGADNTTGLTNTISATYSAYKPSANDVLVEAQMVKVNNSATPVTTTPVGTPVYYHVRAVAKKTTTTSDFSATAAQPFVKVGKTDTVTVTPNGTTALGTVDVKSSDNSIALASATSTLTNNNVQFDITGVKAGNATFTVTWTKADGTTVSHDVSVYVSDSPVVAYVNGKVANPTDTLSFTQSTTVPITFVSADGTKIDTFNYNAGNGKIMSTRAPASTVWNGVSGEYGMYMNGPVGSATGVYVNGQKICNVKVADRPFTCDTTYNFNLKAGKTYEFKLTPAAGTTFDNFTFNTAKDAALSTNGYKKNADGTINAFVKAVQKGTYGVYVTINDVQYKVFAVTVD